MAERTGSWNGGRPPAGRPRRSGLAGGLLRTARPRQWTRNTLVAAPAAAGNSSLPARSPNSRSPSCSSRPASPPCTPADRVPRPPPRCRPHARIVAAKWYAQAVQMADRAGATRALLTEYTAGHPCLVRQLAAGRRTGPLPPGPGGGRRTEPERAGMASTLHLRRRAVTTRRWISGPGYAWSASAGRN